MAHPHAATRRMRNRKESSLTIKSDALSHHGEREKTREDLRERENSRAHLRKSAQMGANFGLNDRKSGERNRSEHESSSRLANRDTTTTLGPDHPVMKSKSDDAADIRPSIRHESPTLRFLPGCAALPRLGVRALGTQLRARQAPSAISRIYAAYS